MIKIICDKTGVEEELNGAIEVRPGRRDRETGLPTWEWVIKDVDKLENFSVSAYEPELDLHLSKTAAMEARLALDTLKEENKDEYKALIDSLKIKDK